MLNTARSDSIQSRLLKAKNPQTPEPEFQAILEQAMEATAATGAAIALRTKDAVRCRASTGH